MVATRVVVVELVADVRDCRLRTEDRSEEVCPRARGRQHRIRVVIEGAGDLLRPDRVACASVGGVEGVGAVARVVRARNCRERPAQVVARDDVAGAVVGGLDSEEPVRGVERPDLGPVAARVLEIDKVDRTKRPHCRSARVTLVTLVTLWPLRTRVAHWTRSARLTL